MLDDRHHNYDKSNRVKVHGFSSPLTHVGRSGIVLHTLEICLDGDEAAEDPHRGSQRGPREEVEISVEN